MEKTPLDNFENIDNKPNDSVDKLINILGKMPKWGYAALGAVSTFAYGQYWKAAENITDWSVMEDLPAFRYWLSEPMTLYIPALVATCLGVFELAVRAKDEGTATKLSKILNKAYALIFLISFGHTMYQQNQFNNGYDSVVDTDAWIEIVDSEAFRQWVARAEVELRRIREENAANQEALRPTPGARTDANTSNFSTTPFIDEAVSEPELLWVDDDEPRRPREAIQQIQELRKSIASERVSWKDQSVIDRNIKEMEDAIERAEKDM